MSTNMSEDTNNLITMQTAADIRRISRQAIFNLIRRGKLSATEIDGVKFVKRDEVLNFVKAKGGRPKKEKSNNEK
jgi:predicted DNA-binding protein YlxM (UPF0122 family)